MENEERKNDKIGFASFIFGLFFGLLVAGSIGYIAYDDASRKGDQAFERIRVEYERSNNIVSRANEIVNGLIESSSGIKNIAERNLVLIRGLKELVTVIIPDK